MAKYENCPVCGVLTGQLKIHLKKDHGWKYTDESSDFPAPPKPNMPEAE